MSRHEITRRDNHPAENCQIAVATDRLDREATKLMRQPSTPLDHLARLFSGKRKRHADRIAATIREVGVQIEATNTAKAAQKIGMSLDCDHQTHRDEMVTMQRERLLHVREGAANKLKSALIHLGESKNRETGSIEGLDVDPSLKEESRRLINESFNDGMTELIDRNLSMYSSSSRE